MSSLGTRRRLKGKKGWGWKGGRTHPGAERPHLVTVPVAQCNANPADVRSQKKAREPMRKDKIVLHRIMQSAFLNLGQRHWEAAVDANIHSFVLRRGGQLLRAFRGPVPLQNLQVLSGTRVLHKPYGPPNSDNKQAGEARQPKQGNIEPTNGRETQGGQ